MEGNLLWEQRFSGNLKRGGELSITWPPEVDDTQRLEILLSSSNVHNSVEDDRLL